MRNINRITVLLVITLCIVLSGCSFTTSGKYEKAQSLLAKGNYEKAITIFTDLGNYEDSNKFVMYTKAIVSAEEGNFEAAIKTFAALEDFQDSKLRVVYYHARQLEEALYFDSAEEIYRSILMFLDSATRAENCPVLKKEAYDRAMELSKRAEYEEAIQIYTILGSYLDAKNQIEYCEEEIWKGETYSKACDLQIAAKYEDAIRLFTKVGDYSDSQTKIMECQESIHQRDYKQALNLFESGKYETALAIFEKQENYSDSARMISECKLAINTRDYNVAVELLQKNEYELALQKFTSLGSFSDSAEKVTECREKIKERDYAAALEYLENGILSNAYDLLISVGSYKDAPTLLSTDDRLIGARKTKEYRIIGNTVELGKYKVSHKRDIIEWIVLDYDNSTNQVLLISKYELIRMGHKLAGGYSYSRYPTWEKSDIRQWLHSQFINSAFSYDERNCIVEKEIETPEYDGGSGGPVTKDKLFVLSRDETSAYLSNISSRKTYLASDYYGDMEFWGDLRFTNYFPWWLRDPGKYGWMTSYVSEDGAICDDGYASALYAVRPAFYLDLSAYAKLIE